MDFTLKHVLISFLVAFVFNIIEIKCEVEDMSIEEIRQRVAEAIRKDYLELLQKQMGQTAGRTQRNGRSKSGRKPSLLASYHPNLFQSRFGKRRLTKNHAEYKRKLMAQSKSTFQRHWRNHLVPLFSRKKFAIIDIHWPSAKRNGKLLNRLGKVLAVTETEVRGATHPSAANTRLQIESVGFGAVMIKGIDTNRYICMAAKKGNVYASLKKSYECVFMERTELNHYHTYQSFEHRNQKRWYLSINNEGRMMNGRRSKFHKRSSQFIRISFN